MSASVKIKSTALAELTPQLREQYLQRLCTLRGLQPAVTSQYRPGTFMVSLTRGQAAEPNNFWSNYQIWLDTKTGDFGYDGDYGALRTVITQFEAQLKDLHRLTVELLDPLAKIGVVPEIRIEGDGSLAVFVDTPEETQTLEVVL